MQETRVLVETRGTTGEETISYWFDLPIDVAEFEEKLGIGAESQDYRIIEKVLPYADEVHEHTSVYQLKIRANKAHIKNDENTILNTESTENTANNRTYSAILRI
jgi:hypothetical protein